MHPFFACYISLESSFRPARNDVKVQNLRKNFIYIESSYHLGLSFCLYFSALVLAPTSLLLVLVVVLLHILLLLLVFINLLIPITTTRANILWSFARDGFNFHDILPNCFTWNSTFVRQIPRCARWINYSDSRQPFNHSTLTIAFYFNNESYFSSSSFSYLKLERAMLIMEKASFLASEMIN